MKKINDSNEMLWDVFGGIVMHTGSHGGLDKINTPLGKFWGTYDNVLKYAKTLTHPRFEEPNKQEAYANIRLEKSDVDYIGPGGINYSRAQKDLPEKKEQLEELKKEIQCLEDFLDSACSQGW